MNVGKIDKTQSFQALNFNNVSTLDRIYLKNDFKKIQEFAKEYNIRLTSVYSNSPDFGVIDVDVMPLSKNLSFFRKIFPPIGRETFHTNDSSILDSIKSAIQDLAAKINK